MGKVFVYGTLRQGQANCHVVDRWVASRRMGTVEGQLYHLPEEDYPAAIVPSEVDKPVMSLDGGCQTVHGELLTFTDFPAALAAMDELEDYHGPGQNNLYERIAVPVMLSDSSVEEAYIYVFTEEKRTWLHRHAEFIPGGDWVARG